jgi:hypothetical protein
MDQDQLQQVVERAADRAVATAGSSQERGPIGSIPQWLKPVLVEFGRELLGALLSELTQQRGPGGA